MIDPGASEIITRELAPNERILWTGKPRQGIYLRVSDTFLIPMSLLWCAFVVFWEARVFNSGAPLFFILWGIPFVLVGLYVVAGRFLVDAKQRSKTFYGLTEDRIIIVSGLFQKKTKTLNLQTLSDISLTEREDRTGTITFGPSPPFYSWVAGASWPGLGQMAVPSFEAIENARTVYDLINNAKQKK